jgi:tRNA 2-thiouridine synthesizing protein A
VYRRSRRPEARMTAIMLTTDRMDVTLDARGLACPLPAIKARRALAALPPGAALIVLATDPEAPIDVAAVAVDAGCSFEAEREGAAWRLTLRRPG